MSFKIGVDGGGTKTECILVDSSGQTVASHVGPGCNPSVIGPAQAAANLHASLEPLRAQALALATGRPGPHLISHTLLCMAGHPDFWRDLAQKLEGFGHVTAAGDYLPVLELATGGRPGLVMHAGTGSFVSARAPDGSVHFAGGLGWRFGDPGSGYDLGREAVARGLLEFQGWAPPSPIGDAIREHAGLEPGAEASRVSRAYYQHPEANRQIAALAPTVLRLAAAGEPVARGIALASTGKLLDLAVVVATRLFSTAHLATVPVGLCGPILNHPVVHEALVARAPFPLTAVTATPIEGVRRVLART